MYNILNRLFHVTDVEKVISNTPFTRDAHSAKVETSTYVYAATAKDGVVFDGTGLVHLRTRPSKKYYRPPLDAQSRFPTAVMY
jgi:hypothetical protein